ncbi:MAG TPA: hypothetical protein VFG15_02965 [Amycolatopsis sp.]|nr:hypothetical protein [Amycolatopsis sp.]
MDLPAEHYAVTTPTGTLIGHTWPGPWARPYVPAGGRENAWFARSVHDDPADPFLHDFSTPVQAEQFLRARDLIAGRSEAEAALLAHPERRTTGDREVLIWLEGSADQPLPAWFTYNDGPRFRTEIADIVIAIINRGYRANHEMALAYRDDDTITVIDPNVYADFPDYTPDQFRPDEHGRYGLIPHGAWYPVNGDEESPTE